MTADYMQEIEAFTADRDDLDNFDNSKRYSIIYEGYLFEGDSKGMNRHDFERFDDALEIYHHYGDIIQIDDNYYGVSLIGGEWQ